jgi:hypothetical protein
MGPESLALWHQADRPARSGEAARQAGLRHRPVEQLLRDVLVWERARGLDRTRTAGLSAGREQALLEALARQG